MADSNMSIPVRTQNAGDVVAQLVDATNVLNKLKILADGSINVNVISGGGGGTIRNNIISGQGFVGAQPTQVNGFSTVAVQANILSLTTIEIPSQNLVDVVVGSPILAVTGLVASSTTVSSIAGNVLTLNKSLLGGVGTTQTITFTNIQFNVPNVARQIVVIGGNNGAVTFTGNTVTAKTGGGASYNTAVTIDSQNSTVSTNTFNGEFGTGYAARIRGSNATFSDNVNFTSQYSNAGYYFLPNGAAGPTYVVDSMILYSSLYWKCIQTHVSATNTLPGGVDAASYWVQITLEDVNASGVYGVALLDVGNSISVTQNMVVAAQVASGDPVTISIERYWIMNLAKVQASPIFSDEANWALIGVVYKEATTSLRFTPGYRATDSKSQALKSGMASAQSYEFKKIILSDVSGNLLVIYRTDAANPALFDFTLK